MTTANVYGMDIQAGRDLAARMDGDATEIETLTTRLTGMLESTPWYGPDATRFKGDWSGQYVPALQSVVAALRENSVQIYAQAQSQEDASS
ncbi:MAG TPA: hypothetical protein VKY71_08275 [Actinotalea caeni]|uniref:hypothetical protein n=1 Tax=Actinotalea caeni TaxID=1348467 RepID=UPI0012E17C39|nr:hypothetical protein [Actinotalea caeni]HLV55552.1 hypothetical protein [Actinotalea caeni]